MGEAPQPLPTEGTVPNIPGEALANFDARAVDPNTLKSTGQAILGATNLGKIDKGDVALEDIEAADAGTDVAALQERIRASGTNPDEILRSMSRYELNSLGRLVDANGNPAPTEIEKAYAEKAALPVDKNALMAAPMPSARAEGDGESPMGDLRLAGGILDKVSDPAFLNRRTFPRAGDSTPPTPQAPTDSMPPSA